MPSLLLQPVQALARLVAASTTFQDLVGHVGDASRAMDSVYYQEASDKPRLSEEQANFADPLPRAIITLDQAQGKRIGPGNWQHPAGLMLALQAIPPGQLRGRSIDESVWFLTLIEKILQEMEAASGGADASNNPLLNMSGWQIVDGPMPCEVSENEFYFWGVDLRVTSPN